MKTAFLAASLLILSSAALASDVGVSINVGQPGFYGRIDIGNFPQPQLVYRQPLIIQRPAHYVPSPPLYLRVPPGHAKNWSKHCRAYNACGQQVYFVQDQWYTNEYAPRYRAQHGEHGRGRGNDEHGPGRGHNDRDDNRGDNRGDERGPGNGHGKDKHHG